MTSHTRGFQEEGTRKFETLIRYSDSAKVAKIPKLSLLAGLAVTARMDRGEADLLDVLVQVETAFKQVIHVGTAAQLAAARDLLVTARRQLYRILADDSEGHRTAPRDTLGLSTRR